MQLYILFNIYPHYNFLYFLQNLLPLINKTKNDVGLIDRLENKHTLFSCSHKNFIFINDLFVFIKVKTQ